MFVCLCVWEREREIDFVILTRAWPCIPVLEQTFLNFLGRWNNQELILSFISLTCVCIYIYIYSCKPLPSFQLTPYPNPQSLCHSLNHSRACSHAQEYASLCHSLSHTASVSLTFKHHCPSSKLSASHCRPSSHRWSILYFSSIFFFLSISLSHSLVNPKTKENP